MPCSSLEAALEPPLFPTPPLLRIDPRITPTEAFIMRQADLETTRVLQQFQRRRHDDIQAHRSIIDRQARGLPVPSQDEAIDNLRPRLRMPLIQQIRLRALDHYRVIVSRGRLTTELGGSGGPRPCSRDLPFTRMKSVIRRVREANESQDDPKGTQVHSIHPETQAEGKSR
ncbi:hypothetical protein TWF718_002806 [Orbilia javanica]|uniref:Uncharacterized protein n=1 Tax=Orbilia javanica TaxID=47235 RepID=A0AAN8MM81_9PEZI